MNNYSEALEYQVRLLHWVIDPRTEVALTRVIPQKNERDTIETALRFADPYYWNREMCDLVYASYRGIPETNLSLDFLPAPHGFFWFDEPLPMPPYRAEHGGLVDHWVKALAWTQIRLLSWPTGQVKQFDNAPLGVGVVPFEMMEAGLPLIPTGVWCWGPGETQSQAARGNKAPKDERERALAGAVGPNGLTGSQTLVKIVLDLLLCASALVKQTILVTPGLQVDRHTRKRVAREGWTREPLVRVVELRRREKISERAQAEHTEHEWSCQWVVRGHWRQQFYPSKHANQPLWITPYVKGPEDKPLKAPRATLFAVVR